MQLLRTVSEVRAWRAGATGEVGLVPTMGYLHEGHLSLVRAARIADEHVIVSIFVNPAQFSPTEDLARYPRNEAHDLAMLEAAHVDAVFAPDAAEIYPAGFDTYVTVDRLTQRLEGASRPTHFRGVTTVVLKLLNVVRPDRAYFGQKDAQQLAAVRHMVLDLDLAVEVIGLPIVREPDGLAMSSRNLYLTPEQRQAALALSRSLRLAEDLYGSGERDPTVIRARMRALIESEPLAQIDYLSIADADTLEELDRVVAPALVSLAVRFGDTRLVDNTAIG